MAANVFQISGSAAAVLRYVDGGGLEGDLSLLEMQAASDAFKKSRIATDRKAQIWSVVNHLETAEAALCRYVENNRFIRTVVKATSRCCRLADLIKVRMLMATCYIYLEERELASTMLDRAESCFGSIGNFGAAEMIHFLTGMVYTDLPFSKGEMFSPSDVESTLEPAVDRLRRALPSK